MSKTRMRQYSFHEKVDFATKWVLDHCIRNESSFIDERDIQKHLVDELNMSWETLVQSIRARANAIGSPVVISNTDRGVRVQRSTNGSSGGSGGSGGGSNIGGGAGTSGGNLRPRENSSVKNGNFAYRWSFIFHKNRNKARAEFIAWMPSFIQTYIHALLSTCTKDSISLFVDSGSSGAYYSSNTPSTQQVASTLFANISTFFL